MHESNYAITHNHSAPRLPVHALGATTAQWRNGSSIREYGKRGASPGAQPHVETNVLVIGRVEEAFRGRTKQGDARATTVYLSAPATPASPSASPKKRSIHGASSGFPDRPPTTLCPPTTHALLHHSSTGHQRP